MGERKPEAATGIARLCRTAKHPSCRSLVPAAPAQVHLQAHPPLWPACSASS